MNHRVVEKDSFKVIGRRRTTPNGGGTWDICRSDGSIEQMQDIGGPACAFLGLCFGFDSEGNNDYMVGIETVHDTVPGLEEYTYPSSKWLVFDNSGSLSDNVLGDTWKYIYDEYLPQNQYKQAELPTIEVYREWNDKEDICRIEVWIPIQ